MQENKPVNLVKSKYGVVVAATAVEITLGWGSVYAFN